jgi:hypothetical protein
VRGYSGKLVDVIPIKADYGGLAVLPHGEAGFKIEGRAARPQSDYVTHKTFVRWAKDSEAWP